ncbi:MAG: cell division protein ZapB [Deltaproteobacteria bacterium]|nr:cell division protein ZapB [Deltaproteobacteria bacterium]
MELTQFKELEDKINSMVHEYSVIKKRNHDLEEQLKKKTGELEEINNKIKELMEERDAVSTKVDRLLILLQDVNTAQ